MSIWATACFCFERCLSSPCLLSGFPRLSLLLCFKHSSISKIPYNGCAESHHFPFSLEETGHVGAPPAAGTLGLARYAAAAAALRLMYTVMKARY